MKDSLRQEHSCIVLSSNDEAERRVFLSDAYSLAFFELVCRAEDGRTDD